MDILRDEDWRKPGENTASQTDAESIAPTRALKRSDPFHSGARAGSFREEKQRAQDIVGAAKGAVAATFDDVRFGRRIKVADLEPIVDAIAGSILRNPLALPGVTRLRDRHEYTYVHSIAVCGLMIGLAKELGLDAGLTQSLGLAGLLHDIGKSAIPLSILDKPGPLTAEERAVIEQHPRRGHELLVHAGIDCEIALDVCLNHHERIDGRGYPAGLSGATLSVYARMAAVCDVYDATTAARAYKGRWSPGEALEWMAEAHGQFDGRVLRAFRQMIGIFPQGSLVRLASDRLAVVLGAETDPATPKVAIFLCALTRRDLTLAVVDTLHDPIVGVELPTRWALTDWPRRRAEILLAF